MYIDSDNEVDSSDFPYTLAVEKRCNKVIRKCEACKKQIKMNEIYIRILLKFEDEVWAESHHACSPNCCMEE